MPESTLGDISKMHWTLNLSIAMILGHHWFLSITYISMDVIDPHQFIDVGLFVRSAVQISNACFEYRNIGRNKMGKIYNFELKDIIKKWNIYKQEPYATQPFEKQYIL